MSEAKSLKREFELERMILFSDAVFAIAITLLIIDIKFPKLPVSASAQEIAVIIKPMIIHFGAFVVSFIFIASMWSRHLQIFRFLCAYDKGLIIRNLAFIFFIVCFPFVVSGLAQNAPHEFVLPLVLYLVNIACTVFCQYLICRYIFISKSKLCYDENPHQKKYLFLQVQYTSLLFLIALVLFLAAYLIFNGNFLALVYTMYWLPLGMIFIRKRLKKYKLAAELEKGE